MIKQKGLSKMMIVTDKGLTGLNLLDGLYEGLKADGIDYVVYDKTQPNPSICFFWVNPFLNKKKLSLRARNLDVEPIKVNDKIGNPILIGLVLVWKLKDTYKAMFEIDSQTMAASAPTAGNANQVSLGNAVANRMNAFENFVMIQSDAALRQVAGQYAYDDNEADTEELTPVSYTHLVTVLFTKSICLLSNRQ